MSCASARCGWCWSQVVRSRISPEDLGIHREALREWVRQAEADQGSRRDRLTSDERERLKALERENRELRRANEILKAASVFFAKELDLTRPK